MTSQNRRLSLNYTPHFIISTLCLIIAGLATFRLVYIGYFPDLAWAANPWIVFPAAALLGLVGSLIFYGLGRPAQQFIWPLAINLVWVAELVPLEIFQSASTGLLLLLITIWLCGFFFYLHHFFSPIGEVPNRSDQRGEWLWGTVLLLLAFLPLYLTTMSSTVGTADTFEFQVTVPQLGIVHPTGYPLYLLLGRLWTFIPINTAAWRLNFGTAVYGWLTLWLTFTLLYQLIPATLSGRGAIALFTALYIGSRGTIWEQSIAAEVYTLHLLFIGLILITLQQLTQDGRQTTIFSIKGFVLLSFLIGLGLTNHLTTIFMLLVGIVALLISPPGPETLTLNRLRSDYELPNVWRVTLAGLLPLLLYAYLPIRWQAVNEDQMGLSRFIDWVIGGRFQNALQPLAWYNDLTRYDVVWRLIQDEWPDRLLVIALIGLLALAIMRWRSALVWVLVAGGYAFFCLNYYVPDLSVFLLPTTMTIGLFVGAGIWGVVTILNRLSVDWLRRFTITSVFVVLALDLAFDIGTLYPELYDARNENERLVEWGRGVYDFGPAEDGIILADSVKHPPLEYLHRAEGIRPDLDIQLQPNEAAYLNALASGLAEGKPVYLARFLPQLAGQYQLDALGPLTEVYPAPRSTDSTPPLFKFGPLELLRYEIRPQATVDPYFAEIELTWQLTDLLTSDGEGPGPNELVYLRWQDDTTGDLLIAQHPVNDLYPLNGWSVGSPVQDYYLLPHSYPFPASRTVEIGFAPPFTPIDEIAWQPIAEVSLLGLTQPDQLLEGTPVTVRANNGAVWEVALPSQLRPGRELSFNLLGDEVHQFDLVLISRREGAQRATLHALKSVPRLDAGSYQVALISENRSPLSCGWLKMGRLTCPIGTIDISGPVVPAGATNFGDEIALTDLSIDSSNFGPGGVLNVTLTWESMVPSIENDYTIFLQVLDPNDQLVGQVDAKPLQGTRPTTAWVQGEPLTDPHIINLSPEMGDGPYRLILGFYTLEDLKRVPVINSAGEPVGDFFSFNDLP